VAGFYMCVYIYIYIYIKVRWVKPVKGYTLYIYTDPPSWTERGNKLLYMYILF
jgi:hypothetical protein